MRPDRILNAFFMRIQIESPHLEVDASTEKLIRNKFEHLDKKYDRIGRCDIVLRKEKSDQLKRVLLEARLEVPKGILFASEKDGRLELAVGKVIAALEHQLLQHKEKLGAKR